MQLGGDAQCENVFTSALLPRNAKLNCIASMHPYNLVCSFFCALFAVYLIFENTFCIN